MSDLSNAHRALALVLEYEECSTARREPFEACEEFTVEDGTCYHVWKYGGHGANSYGDVFDVPRAGRPTDEDMDDWCQACRCNEAVVQRRYAASKRRGAVLRSMLALARKAAKEAS